MKPLKTALAAVIVSTVLLYGADPINTQIEAVQKASPQERVELMNKLKVQLASMNEEERANTISTIRAGMGGTTMNGGVSQSSMSGFPRMQQNMQAQQTMRMQQSSNPMNIVMPRMGR